MQHGGGGPLGGGGYPIAGTSGVFNSPMPGVHGNEGIGGPPGQPFMPPPGGFGGGNVSVNADPGRMGVDTPPVNHGRGTLGGVMKPPMNTKPMPGMPPPPAARRDLEPHRRRPGSQAAPRSNGGLLMPRKVVLPAHLVAFLDALEAQDPRVQPDRLAALDAAEKVAGKAISLDNAQRYPEFKARYGRWEERLRLALADAQIGRVMAGRASAAPVIAAMGGFDQMSAGAPSNGGARGGLGRHHAARKGEFSRW
jgi:hypothetical protein